MPTMCPVWSHLIHSWFRGIWIPPSRRKLNKTDPVLPCELRAELPKGQPVGDREERILSLVVTVAVLPNCRNTSIPRTKIRQEVHDWRANNYAGESATSKALLGWSFETGHLIENVDGFRLPFRYYFAQREAVETVVWLRDVRRARDKFDLLRFDTSADA